MAFHTQKQFADLIGKSRGWLNVYVGRGTITMSGDYIDDTLEKNLKFLNKWLAKKNAPPKEIPKPEKVKPIKTGGPKISEPQPVKLKAPKISEPKRRQVEPSPIDEIEVRKKLAETEYKEAQVIKTNLQSAKLRGDSIPTNLVSGLVSTLGRSFQTSYKNGAEVLLIELAHKIKLSAKIEAEVKGKLIELINKAHADAIQEAKTTIETIVSEVAAVEANKND